MAPTVIKEGAAVRSVSLAAVRRAGADRLVMTLRDGGSSFVFG
jgi:hypothetical protein